MLANLVYVAAGGALGASLRYLAGLVVAFPFGTLGVNVLGSLAIGILWATQADKTGAMMAFLMVGVLGGFTTFSSFSLDVFRLIDDGRFPAAGAYVLTSVLLSLLACWIGLMLGGRGAA
jgi:CrcB protein